MFRCFRRHSPPHRAVSNSSGGWTSTHSSAPGPPLRRPRCPRFHRFGPRTSGTIPNATQPPSLPANPKESSDGGGGGVRGGGTEKTTPKTEAAAAEMEPSGSIKPTPTTPTPPPRGVTVGGDTMLSVLRQLYPPAPVVHLGAVGVNTAIITGSSSSSRRSGGSGAAVTADARSGLGLWQRYCVLASTSVGPSHHGSSSSPGLGGPLPLPYPRLFSEHIFLPQPTTALAAPLRAIASGKARCISSGGGEKEKGEQQQGTGHATTPRLCYDCPLNQWPDAPSLYGHPVAPLHLPPLALRRLSHLCFARERQLAPSLLLLEERPATVRWLRSGGGRSDTSTDSGGGATRVLCLGPGAAAAAARSASNDDISGDSGGPHGGDGSWVVRTVAAVAEVPVVVGLERVPVSPNSDGGGESPLVKALRQSQRAYLHRHSSSSSGSSLCPPWVWAGSAWLLELDPQLTAVARRLQQQSLPATHDATGGGGGGAAVLPITAWVPPFWSVHGRHNHMSLATTSADGCRCCYTLLLRKVWTVAGAGALTHALWAALNPRAEQQLTAGVAADAMSISDGTGMQNRFLLYPNYDAETGLPFVASALPQHQQQQQQQGEGEGEGEEQQSTVGASGGGGRMTGGTAAKKDNCSDDGGATAALDDLLLGDNEDDGDGCAAASPLSSSARKRRSSSRSSTKGPRSNKKGKSNKKPKKELMQPLTRYTHVIGRHDAGTSVFQLAYARQAVCWLNASAGVFAGYVRGRHAASGDGAAAPARYDETALVPVRRVGPFCDPPPPAAGDQPKDGEVLVVSSAAATLFQAACLTGFLLSDPPSWFTEAFDSSPTDEDGSGITEATTATVAAAAIAAAIPAIEAHRVIPHGTHRHTDPFAAPHHETGQQFVFVLQPTMEPNQRQYTPTTTALSAVTAKAGTHAGLFCWHRYHASDVRVNFLYAVDDAMPTQGTQPLSATTGGSSSSSLPLPLLLRGLLLAKGDAELGETDVLFIDVRSALLLLSHAAGLPSSSSSSLPSSSPQRPNVISQYSALLMRQGMMLPSASTSGSSSNSPSGDNDDDDDGVAVSYGSSHFVDYFTLSVRRPVRWSFNDLGRSLAAQQQQQRPESPTTAGQAAAADQKDSSGEGVGDDTADAVRDGDPFDFGELSPDGPTTAATTAAEANERQEAFLRTLELRCEADAGAGVDLPVVDRRALGPGTRLYEAFTHPRMVAEMARVAAVVLGADRAAAILAARSSAALQDRMLSLSTASLAKDGKGKGRGKGNGKSPPSSSLLARRGRKGNSTSGGSAGETRAERESRFDAHLPALTGTSNGNNTGGAMHDATPTPTTADSDDDVSWVVEGLLQTEADRTAERLGPWLKLFAPAPPSSKKGRRRKSGKGRDDYDRGALGLESTDGPDASAGGGSGGGGMSLAELEDSNDNTRDATLAMQHLVTSPLREQTTVVYTTTTTDDGDDIKQQQQQRQQCHRSFHSWDLGLSVLDIQYRERYVNAINTEFSD